VYNFDYLGIYYNILLNTKLLKVYICKLCTNLPNGKLFCYPNAKYTERQLLLYTVIKHFIV